jgi:thiamine-phosphate pyrophosphorylase
MTDRFSRLRSARLYLVCDDRSEEFLAGALEGGVDMVQLRMKEAADESILEAADRFRRICDRHGALFILNDRPDLVGTAEADGVHVGQDDAPVVQARAMVGEDRLVGLSTHTPEQVEGADGADYIGVGPVHETPTKPGRAAATLELVRYAAAHAEVPFFAIGGIAPQNVASVREAGARRIAVVRALTESPDPETAARVLKAAIQSEPVGST